MAQAHKRGSLLGVGIMDGKHLVSDLVRTPPQIRQVAVLARATGLRGLSNLFTLRGQSVLFCLWRERCVQEETAFGRSERV